MKPHRSQFLMFFRKIMALLIMAAVCGTAVAQESKKNQGPGSALVKKVIEELQKSEKPDFDKAINSLEAGIKADAKDRDAKMLLVQILETTAMRTAQDDDKKAEPYFLKAATMLRDVMKSENSNAQQIKFIAETVFYNEACVLAKSGKADAAMASLKDAFAAGVNNVSLVETDADLKGLRDREDFKLMVKELKGKALAEARKEFAEKIAGQKAFAFDFNLKDLDGKSVKLADFKGKYTIVDIWGTWCPPCRAEIPHFIDLLAKYKAKGLEIVGINYEGGDDEKENIKTIKEFNKRMKVPYNCVLGDEKTQKQVPNFEGYPTTLFLDRSGKVRMVIVGGEPLFRLEAAVEALMESDKSDTAKSE
ncbi:MAG: TlpA disulfide reductase family protein [bacterium]